jgi:hypothetical protein
VSTPASPLPALLFCSVLASDWRRLDELRDALANRFGDVALVSEPIAFTQTAYYNEELGEPVSRRFIAFDSLREQDRLLDAKLDCNKIERTFARKDGRRRFNVDPGLLNYERVVLATGKNFPHRIYLGRGVFADLELTFERGRWKVLPWTYPDYAGLEIRNQLTKLREMYKAKVLNIPVKAENKRD